MPENDENKSEIQRKLLELQKQIERTSLTADEINVLIKSLNKYELEMLKDLYKIQISNLKRDLNNYKHKIIKIKDTV